ncbi:histidine kinase (plasmid) [Gemmobacter aquarius]|uniref:histidine kinase n=1 Tax=Paragemmobacter aquarius TaxID=2169400 RepID=A0A2S0URU3_9RHOB|nr:sensor histidine kinase [Gemmobacter aquarius]AWB50513.1 histidine kinase [Gemmobacter aquarius]
MITVAPSEAARRFIDRLGVRLGLVIGLALLPVGAMAVIQANDLLSEARARSEAALAGETLRAVRPKLGLIKRAQGMAEALAALGPGTAGCEALWRVVDGSDFAFAGYYGTNGQARCRTPAAPPSFVGSRGLAAILTGSSAGLALMRGAKDSVDIVALHPERDAGGVVTGFAAVSPKPASTLSLATEKSAASSGFSLFLFDRSGAVLSGQDGYSASKSLLPQGQPLQNLADPEVASFTATSEGGGERVYSLVRLVEGELFALGTWPAERRGLAAMNALPPLVMPALMWAMSLIAAWIAAEMLVTRHIRRLRSAIRDFAGGNRVVRPLDMKTAPREIRDATEAFQRMTDAILRDEAELEDMLREKELLLREVHHRVKNNLQLIASIVNMQLRRTRSDETRSVMRALQERVVSLAAIHNGLYQTSDLSEISVQTLFSGIIEQVTRNAQVRGQIVAVESNLQPVQLTVDQAVPLALLLTEALSNALKYAGTEDGTAPRIVVTFSVEKTGEAQLEVANSVTGTARSIDLDTTGTGIGTQLLRGFTKQLGGEFSREFTGGMCYLRVWFSLLPRAEAA